MYQMKIDGKWVTVSVALAYEVAKHHLVSTEKLTPSAQQTKAWELLDAVRLNPGAAVLKTVHGQELRWDDN